MQEDYTVFNIPRTAYTEPVVFDKPATAEVVATNEPVSAEPDFFNKPAAAEAIKNERISDYDTDDYLTHERRKDDNTSSIYDELNKIAEELERCRLRNC